MNRSQLKKLINNYLRGTASQKEITELERWYASFDKREGLTDLLNEEQKKQLESRLLHSLNTAIDVRLHSLDKNKTRIRKINPRNWFILAAALLIFLSFGLYFYPRLNLETGTAQVSQLIRPGGNKAVLTLYDGSEILLDTVKPGLLVDQGNITIRKNKDGQVVYQVHGEAGADRKSSETAYNTISTPRGGQFQIELPDGTKVWLNAASSLKFPAFFSSAERIVELKGEAYFEVAKSRKRPFKVMADGSSVEVLGTHFNVMAYEDESSTNTTLLEGSVRIVKGDQNRMLVPGQEAKVSGEISVSNVDAKQAIAWKEGYFLFDNESIESIMRKISRWYNVDIEYKGNNRYKKFGGTISKFENIDQVLKIIELTGVINFKMEGRRVIVMP